MNFSNKLINWYLKHKRSLPWRETTNPYYIWTSEIILQQTQISQGLPYYNVFIEEYPTIFDLAKADEKDVLNLWQGLGYYSRARNLHFTAKQIANELNGVFPDNYKDLLELKGIGDYTASAIASICFNEVTPVVDGNVYRFMARYFGIHTPINSSAAKKEFKALALHLIDKKNPGDFNQAVMEFGSRQCKPQNPDCNQCIFNSSCVAFKDNLVSVLPKKYKSNSIKKRYFNYLVFTSDDNKTIIEKRQNKGIWQNLYQFPLIETEKSVKLIELKRVKDFSLLMDQYQYEIHQFNEIDIIHKLSHQHLYTKFWVISVYRLPSIGISLKDLKDYPFPTLINNFLKEFNF